MSDFGDESEKPDEPEETFEEAVFDASIPDDLSELESEGDQEVVLEEPNAAPEDYTQEEVMGIIKQRDDYLASLQRLQAEFENFKKRTQRQAEELSERGGEILAKRLIPALDVLELALGHSVTEGASEDTAKTLAQISSAFYEVLEKEGLEILSPQGEPFDPNKAEAVMHEDGEGAPTVVAVLRSGYSWKGRVLRPAMVKVSGGE